ncbi:hypothetical protein [Candidatus Gillettellia adelgis]
MNYTLFVSLWRMNGAYKCWGMIKPALAQGGRLHCISVTIPNESCQYISKD